MFILEVKNNIEVETPRGKGRVLYITEYGMEIEKMFTVAIDESGEIWEFTNRDIRMVSNLTFGRKLPRRSPEYFQEQGTVFPAPKKDSDSVIDEKETKEEPKMPESKPLNKKLPKTNGTSINGNASMRPSIH